MQSSKSRRGGTCMRMGWMMLQPILPPDCVHQAAALMQHLPHCRTQSLVAKTGSDRRAVQRFREAAQRRRCVFGMVCCVHETCAQSRRHSRQPFVSTAGVLRAQPVERRGVWPQVEVRYSACGAWHPLRVAPVPSSRGLNWPTATFGTMCRTTGMPRCDGALSVETGRVAAPHK